MIHSTSFEKSWVMVVDSTAAQNCFSSSRGPVYLHNSGSNAYSILHDCFHFSSSFTISAPWKTFYDTSRNVNGTQAILQLYAKHCRLNHDADAAQINNASRWITVNSSRNQLVTGKSWKSHNNNRLIHVGRPPIQKNKN